MYARALRAGSIGTLKLANRIVMGSMHLGIEADGAALAAFYAQRARGGAGLIVTGGSCVNHEGAGGRNYSFINEPHVGPAGASGASRTRSGRTNRAAALSRGTLFVSFVVRLAAGRAIGRGIAFLPDPPRALGEAEILETIGDFANGAFARASSDSTRWR